MASLIGERVLVTGAAGSVGQALCSALLYEGVELLATDIDTLDVTGWDWSALTEYEPSLVYHLAAAKSAPAGEDDPAGSLLVNAVGTMNLLHHAGGARVILASTCKAADPETVYGASKLIAERLVLASGGSVARFYNVAETQGNVFEHWRSLPAGEPIPVTPCSRYFITLDECVDLLLTIPACASGRYTVDPGEVMRMSDVAALEYPGRSQVVIPPRRGDRRVEPLHARSEILTGTSPREIISVHERVFHCV